MKVLSLFDGMACAMLAMMRAGILVDTYDAYEIDKYAIAVTQHNFPIVRHHGDVFKADFTEYEGVDYLMGGSPCTYWSIAQKNNRETEASGLGWELFSQYVRALREAKPKYFVYENNKSMSNAIRESITETFGFEPICINSALVSAQNRQRLYWVGIRQPNGTYKKADIQQPKDKGILLKDILETGGDLTSNDKAWTLTASYNGAVAGDTIKRFRRNMVAEPINTTPDGKSQTLKAQYQKNNASNFCCYKSTYGASAVAEPVCVAQRGRYSDSGNRSKKSARTIEQFYEARDDGKINTLTTVSKDNAVAQPIRIGAMPRPNGELSTSQGMRIYAIDGKSVTQSAQGGGWGAKTRLYAVPTPSKSVNTTIYTVKDGQITIKDKQYPIKLADGNYIIRKLTVRECMRLQTIPEWYDFNCISKTQAYKCLGNGWTVDVIAHLLGGLK